MSEARLDIGCLLSEEMLPQLDRPKRIRLLLNCRIAVFGNCDGWHSRVDKTGVSSCTGDCIADFERVIEQALRVLKTRPDLYPSAEAW